jgi:Lrp/AsnC family transcriptional regulator for asnA, asnC and gidA
MKQQSEHTEEQLDVLDKQIIAMLIEDARLPFTEIAKKLMVSPGTIHVRVKKLEQAGIIKGASLIVDYEAVGYNFTAYVGVHVSESRHNDFIMSALRDIPEVTVAHIATGTFSIFCKVRCKDARHAKQVIYRMNDIEHVQRTETMISLEESINDKKRLFQSIFN